MQGHALTAKIDGRPTLLARIIAGFDRMNAAIATVCAVIACVLAALIAAVVFGGVVMRYVFNSPLQWQEEFPKLLMVWMTFTGVVFVYRQRKHIEMDILPRALSGRAAAGLKLGIALVSMSVLVVFLVYGLTAAEGAKGQRIILLESLSLFWVYLAVPVGSALLLLAVLQDALRYLHQLLVAGTADMDE